jgi:hypothetical protein
VGIRPRIVAATFEPGGTRLQRLFSTFPAGRPGLGLLLLRVAVGVTLGMGAASETGDAPVRLAWAASAVATAASASLVVGFVTPLACALAALGAALHWFVPSLPYLCGTPVATGLVVTIATAVALLGPGAFSLDAYLFGRREVVILPAAAPPEE